MNIQNLVSRTIELSSSMPIGHACFAACREAGINEADIPATASVIATEISNREINAPITPVDSTHQRATQIISAWAIATGRTGGSHKQARQSRIRKIVKNGINSEYTRRIMAEAGMITE